MTTRRRPNYWPNRYNQRVIGGKIAIETESVNPYTKFGEIGTVYQDNEGRLDYSVIGQYYLHALGIKVTEL